MGAIATIKIDLSKIDKTKIYEGKNGSKYYELNLSINDTTDQYGNNVQVSNPQTKEQRDAKEPRTFYGNGKVFWTDGKINVAEKKQVENQTVSKKVEDDLPF
jgi:hypothetical protein